MGILQKHVTKEILAPFGIAFLVLTLLSLLGDLFRELADRFVNKGLDLGDVSLILLYLMPPLAAYTIPIAMLFATLAAYVRFSQDCEIIAMKSAGIPIRKIFAPAVFLGIAATAFLLVIKLEVAPWSKREMKYFIIRTVLRKPTLVLSEQSWTREVDNMRIFVGDIDEERMKLRDINIIVKDGDDPHRTIVAKSGKIYVDDEQEKIFLDLNKGSIHEYDSDTPEDYSTATFKKLTIPVSISKLNRYMKASHKYFEVGQYSKKEMTFDQVLEKLYSPSTGPGEKRSLLRHIGETTALAFMPLTFVLIGAPLGIIPYKARRFYGFAICAVLLIAYYTLLMFGSALSKKGLTHPVLAMWLPNIMLGAAGVIFMARAERQ